MSHTLTTLQLATLAAVAQLEPDGYGVTVRVRMAELLGKEPSVGSVYMALEALQARGLLRSRLGEPTPERGGRAKRYFALTADGVHALERGRAQRERQAGQLAPDWQPR